MLEDSESDNTESSESETSDASSASSNESSSMSAKAKKKKGSLPKKPILVVRQILKKLANDDLPDMGSNSSKVIKGKGFFCIEDTFLTKDLKVYVEGIGQISFPLEKSSVEQMIKLSSKAKFGKGKDTVLDTSVRDTQTIPASKLKIEIDSSSLDDLLKRIAIGLNVGKNCQLIPHLHNLLIYGPGQFFKKHTDSEKVQNMIATLVVILPFPHEGGELIIQHNKKKHMFFGSKNPDIAKCVAFYSDCAHEIKRVTEGYRVAVTYNVVLKPSDVPDVTEISESLDVAVENYFKSGEKKLAFGLNHSYSKKSLKWNLLKGADRQRVNALLVVARKQGRVPCLALTTYHEVYDKENTHYCPWESPALVVEETDINFMVDEKNTEIKCISRDNLINNYKEFCCTKKAKELFKPYETEASGPTGNEGDTEEFWYRRACLVLWSSKWVYTQGFIEAFSELHQLTKQEGMQEALIEKMNTARKDIAQPQKWEEPKIAEMLIDIVTYLKDEGEAKFILGDLCKYVMCEEGINQLIQLEKIFNDKIWADILEIWKNKGYCSGWNSIVENAHTFIVKYTQQAEAQFKSVVVDALLEEGVRNFIKSEERRRVSKYIYDRKRKESIETLGTYMKMCFLLGKNLLEESLIKHVVGSSYPAVSLGELYTKLMDDLGRENLTPYETIRETAEKCIDARLLELKDETGWTFRVEIACKCKFCSPILEFFASKTSKRYNVAECYKPTYDHLFEVFYSGLNMYFLPCKWSHIRDGRKHKITLEKLPQLLEDRKKLNEDLVKFQEKIRSLKEFSFVDVKVENEDECNVNLLEDFSSIEITENVKAELLDDKEGIFGLFPPPEQVDIKTETSEQTDEYNCDNEEVPKKRQKRQLKVCKK